MKILHRRLLLVALLLALATPAAVPAVAAAAVNTLITDSLNHRVIEVDAAGAIVWQYGDGASGSGAGQLSFPRSALRLLNGNTLIADTGNHRVLEVSLAGAVVWHFNVDPVTPLTPRPGNLGGRLTSPSSATRLLNGDTLIVDSGQHRVIEVRPTSDPGVDAAMEGTIVWQFGITGTAGGDGSHLSGPRGAQRLPNGHTLIVDTGNARVVEVGRSNPLAAEDTILWQYGSAPGGGGDPDELRTPSSAQRLGNGDTMIADTGNERVIEVTMSKAVLWQYGETGVAGTTPGHLRAPTAAIRLGSGYTLIADTGSQRVLQVSFTGWIPWQYGEANLAGTAAGLLDSPTAASLVDTQVPTVSFTSPAAGKYVRLPYKIVAAANDDSSVGMVEFYDDAGFLGYDLTAPFELRWTGAAPQPSAANGAHLLEIVAYDEAGNTSTAGVTVHVDGYKPRLAAPYAASGRRLGTALIKFRVTDPYSPKATLVLKIRDGRGRVVQTTSLGSRTTSQLFQSAKVRLKAARGVYRFTLYARDLAGNAQNKVAGNRLTIR